MGKERVRYTLSIMLPVITLGSAVVSTYAVMLAFGLMAASSVTLVIARRQGAPFTPTIDVLLAAMLGGVLGARLLYVAIDWAYFTDHLDEAWQFWRGGLAWHGGLIGGAIGVGLLARWRLRQSALIWLERLAPGVALGAAFGWLGCWLSACAVGREVFPGDAWFCLAVDAPDAHGLWAPRWPAQWFGAAWSALVFLALGRIRASRAAWFLVLYSAGAWLIGQSRADVPDIAPMLHAALGITGLLMMAVWRRSSFPREIAHVD